MFSRTSFQSLSRLGRLALSVFCGRFGQINMTTPMGVLPTSCVTIMTATQPTESLIPTKTIGLR
jgi:hypothetical protein